MARSSVLGNVASTLGGWIFAAVCVVGSVLYIDEFRAVGRKVLGIHDVPTVAAVTPRSDEPRQSTQSSGGSVSLRADRLGHFQASASVNGSTIDVLVDTGASLVALTAEDAERAGIFVRPGEFTMTANTANGQARFAPVMIDSITIGGITVRDVKGAVSEPGKLNATLLGMSFLGRLSRAEMRRDTLVLEE